MNLPRELKRFGMRAPQELKKYRLVATGDGEPGTGKSDFCFRSAPRPLQVINIDTNIDNIEDRYKDAGDIMIKDVEMPVNIDQDRDLATFQDVHGCIVEGIESGLFRTTMIDEGGQLYELARRGYHGSLDFGDVPQSAFTIVNSKMRKIFRAAKAQRTNLFVIHRLKDEREDITTRNGKRSSTPTGNRILTGWKDTLSESQCHVRFEKIRHWTCPRSACSDGCKKPEQHSLMRFSMEIVKCSKNQAVEGIKFWGSEITFENLGWTVYPNSMDVEGAWR